MNTLTDNALDISVKTTLLNTPHPNQTKRVHLLGLDFGSTTSSALIASANVSNSSITGRMEFSDISILFRSEPEFTPFINQKIDVDKVASLIHNWLNQSELKVKDIFSGGSIITGLAAQAKNAIILTKIITQIVGESIIAAADDPCLESWLAFMGSCSALSRFHTNVPILNLDIGGGTTNAALGINGEVLETGCYFIGARHFQFLPGSYQLLKVSKYGKALLDALNIKLQIGNALSKDHRVKIMTFYVNALEAIVLGNTDFFSTQPSKIHQQVAIRKLTTMPKITFSGGVGELIYQYAAGKELPSTSFFGDFGIDLAIAIANSAILSSDINNCAPENKGRATAYGLTLHSTEISGQTIFLPNPDCLPLNDLPIIAKLTFNETNEQWQRAFTLAASRKLGSCIQIINFNFDTNKLDQLRALAKKIKELVSYSNFSTDKPLVILVETDIGKALGNYITDWGQSTLNIIVIDEIPLRNAHFVNIGRPQQQMIPVSFYGMH